MMRHEIIPELHLEVFIQYKNADIDPFNNGLGQI